MSFQLLLAVDEHGHLLRAAVVDDVEPEPPVVDAVLHHLPVVVSQRAVVDEQHQRGGRLAGAENTCMMDTPRHVAVALELPHSRRVVVPLDLPEREEETRQIDHHTAVAVRVIFFDLLPPS
jgi:hypothetical protein